MSSDYKNRFTCADGITYVDNPDPQGMPIAICHNHPHINHVSYSLPDDLVEILQPIVTATGMTELNRQPAMGMYTEVQNRIHFLEQAAEHAIKQGHLKHGRSRVLEAHIGKLEAFSALLDKNSTIDNNTIHVKEWRKYKTKYPVKKLREIFLFHRAKAKQDDISRNLEARTMISRGVLYEQRIKNEIKLAVEKGWFIVFDTLTLSDDKMKDFYDNPTALRDYFRSVCFKVLAANNMPMRTKNKSDFYRYIAIPEFGTENGRIHWHVVHFMKSLPKGTFDPNYGRKIPNYLMIKTMHGRWKYGFNAPIQVRYTGDAFTQAGWRWPSDKNGKRREASHPVQVAVYVTKYVTKKIGQDVIRKNPKDNQWNSRLRRQLNIINPKMFRIRMSREFGAELPSMENLSNQTLVELTKLHFSVSPMSLLLKQKSKRILRNRLGILTIRNIRELMPETINLLQYLRDLTQNTQESSQQNFISAMTRKLTLTDISNETLRYIYENKLDTRSYLPQSTRATGAK